MWSSLDLQEDTQQIDRLVETSRVLLGLILFIRYFDAFGFFSVDNDYKLICLSGSVISLFLTFGFFSPISLIILFYLQITTPILRGLGNQVTVILIWALIFMSAGSKYSIDSFLNLKKIFFFFKYRNSYSFAIVRFSSIFMFWGICITAMSFHFFDELWLKGEALELLVLTPYLSEYYELFFYLNKHHYGIFKLICTLGLLVQGFWEMFLLPLFFHKKLRYFAIFQGVGFFVICGIFINVSYLPLIELVLWFMICTSFFTKNQFSKGTQNRENKIQEYTTTAIILITSITTIFFVAQNITNDRFFKKFRKKFRLIYNITAQDSVNVFNYKDLMMGDTTLIIKRNNNSAKDLKSTIVPFMDLNGGRLDYLRNDYAYFDSSLKWQRTPYEKKIIDPTPPISIDHLHEKGQSIIRHITRFDNCLTGNKKYDIYFLKIKTERQRNRFIRKSPQLIFKDKIQVNNNNCSFVFKFNWGHNSNKRKYIDILNFINKHNQQ